MPKLGKDKLPSGGGGGGDFIRHVRLLTDRESCVVRFLTDRPDFFASEFHRIMDGGKFKGMKICVKAELGQACKLCDDDDRAGTQILGWAYETYHDYVDKPPHVKDEDLEEVTVGRRTVLREVVEEARLWRYSVMHLNPLEYQYDEEGTLTDREFKWARVGEKGSKRPTYVLKPGAPSKLPKELRELAASLPDLEDVAFGKVESLDGGCADKKPGTRRVGKAKEVEAEPAAYGEVDDPFGEPVGMPAGDDDGDDI